MKAYFSKTELCERMGNRINSNPDTIAHVVDLLPEALAFGLAHDGKAAYANFGGFTIKKRKYRKVKLNGVEHTIPERYVLHFNPDPAFIRQINQLLPEDQQLWTEQD